ncbi:uncharacterized protein LOC128234963 [Mya arenaria]|uniref:uncharacterized protein LOC128234963 n=1 Tax=Mya arenaria TaxID=6604 RepID=UPI0022DF74E4|nr:uncharacterized protein LOC128234963 [Mya arenaria]
MSSVTQSQDETIVGLMAMGFDLKDCQDAINFGKTSVEAAVEWLVAGKPGLTANLSGPTQQAGPSLRLRGVSSDFNNRAAAPFQKPHPIPEASQSEPSKSTTDQSETPMSISSTSQSETVSSDTGQSDSDMVSRYHLNQEQRKYKERFEHKKYEEAKKQAIMDKRRQKEAHARALNEIAGDREKKRLMHAPVHTEEMKASADTEQPSVATVPIPETTASSTCLLQIRLPDGRSMRHSFSPTDSLETAWQFAAGQNYAINNFSFMQPFPRREFTIEEMSRTLADLGLTPTGSLVIQKRQIHSQPTESSQEQHATPEPMETGSVQHIPSPSHHQPSHDHLPKAPRAHAAPRGYRWGHGTALDTDEQPTSAMEMGGRDERENDGQPEGEEMLEEHGHGMPPPAGLGFGGHMGHDIPPPPPGVMGAMDEMLGGLGVGANNQAFGGTGQRLVAEGHQGFRTDFHDRPARELAVERAQARQAAPPPAALGPQQGPSSGPLGPPSLSQVHSLAQMCLKNVANRLNDPRHQLLSLAGISEEMAQIILEFLIKEKLLKPKTLNAFIPCYLRKLVLDCYPYVTNELLHSVRLHTNLNHLSLNACPLITDQGLQCLNTLKKLKRFNMSSCPQLTNKCLAVLTSMPNLAWLNLEQTGVTDLGVIQFLKTTPISLQHLILNRTTITHDVIGELHTGAPHLRSLALESTQIMHLDGIEKCVELESINLANTNIIMESLIFVSKLSALTSLNIANTENINGDEALYNIQRLRLNTLVLPSRHTTTNAGMQYLIQSPLVALDLTNYIFIGNEGMEQISKIKTLKKLLLSNTKVADDGMRFLKDLKSLEVLHLDRCTITDKGASIIGALPNLIDLSLASTGITSRFLLAGHCNKCSNLTKLNLSRTTITRKGVLQLSLPFLQMLNLDGTKVTPDLCVSMVTRCPKLTQILTRNLQPFTRDDEVEEADMEVCN